MNYIQQPESWGLSISKKGKLMLNRTSLNELADEYGTPLHIINENRLTQTAENFISSTKESYSGQSSVHYAFKCNSLPYAIKILRNAGLKAEVATEFELFLALNLGYKGDDIIVNGPSKKDDFIEKAVFENVKIIVVDSLDEIKKINTICKEIGRQANILLRVNPDFVPRGLNSGSATSSRKGSVFGLDYKVREIQKGLKLLKTMNHLLFKGYHFHIGTGIRNPKDYSKCLSILKDLIKLTLKENFDIKMLDVGGGYASITTREMTNYELLLYHSFEKLPSGIKNKKNFEIRNFVSEISESIQKHFNFGELPELIFEPGRAIISPNQFLLLRISGVKERTGIGKWLIADGGISTVCLPVYYEYHEVLLCNEVNRKPVEKVTITGPACFSGDIIYKNKYLPLINKNEVIAIMDGGAYFLPMESSFGFQRSAVISVNGNLPKLVRRRENFSDMICRDYY